MITCCIKIYNYFFKLCTNRVIIIPIIKCPRICMCFKKLQSSHLMSRHVCKCTKWFQLCPTLCDPMDCSPPGSSVHRILQATIQEWVAMPSPPGDLPDPGIEPVYSALQADSLPLNHGGSPSVGMWVKSLSRVRLFVTPWSVAYQASQSMGFSRPQYWSGLPFC